LPALPEEPEAGSVTGTLLAGIAVASDVGTRCTDIGAPWGEDNKMLSCTPADRETDLPLGPDLATDPPSLRFGEKWPFGAQAPGHRKTQKGSKPNPEAGKPRPARSRATHRGIVNIVHFIIPCVLKLKL